MNIKRYEAFNFFKRTKKVIKKDTLPKEIDINSLKLDISEGLIDIKDSGFSIKVDIGGRYFNLNVLISIDKYSGIFTIDEVKDDIITTLDILKDRYNIVDLEIAYKTNSHFNVDTNYDDFIKEDDAYEIRKVYLRFSISGEGILYKSGNTF